MGVHDFCRLLLSQARTEAQAAGVDIPSRITALSDGNSQFFMEHSGADSGEWISACCAYEARAKFIRALIDRKTEGKQ